MKKKEIIIFMPTIDGGGVEKNFFLIANYLSKKFDRISVISLSKNKKIKLNSKINFISFDANFSNLLGRRLKFIMSLFLLLKKILMNRNCVVFCFQGLVYCTLLCKILSVKIIIRSNSSPTGWSKNFLKKILYKKIYNMANDIIVNSEDFRKELKSKFGLKSKCIFNPLNKEEILKKSNIKFNFNFFNKKKDFKIISVARFSDQKDHICLVKSINLIKNKYKNLKVLFIGSGEKKEIIQKLIKELRLERIIKILDFKNNPFPYVKKSNLFVLSSNFEGLPNVLLEAITLNKFVISSNCPTGPSEILDNGKGGLLFEVGNYKELSEKIVFFKENQIKCQKKLNFAKKRLSRFDFSKNLKKYHDILIQY